MQLMEVLRSRRAVRNFSSQPVSQSVLEELIQAAVLAPSAMNRQPWAFAVSIDVTFIETMAAEAKSFVLEHFPRSGPEAELRSMIENADYEIFHHAPALILIFATSGAAQDAEDCCLAAQNLMLAARDKGIGSCWIGLARPWLSQPATMEKLNLPLNYRIVAPIILGYPAEWPESHGRREPVIHWIG
jgi:nitroreductase